MEFKKKILDNGMVILFEKRDLPVVSVAFAVRAGGVNESLNEKGISHFIEHLLYKGTPTRSSRQIAEEIEKKGGILNAFTSEEILACFCKISSDKILVALNLLADIIKNSIFERNELEKERKVIFEEIKMHHDNPVRYAFDEVHKCLYKGTLGENLAGSFDTMNSLDREKVIKKFREIGAPNNLVLCVVGDASFDKIVDFAKENFGKMKGKVPEQKIELKNEIKFEERDGIDQANLVFAYHVPLSGEEGSYVARVLSALTAEGLSSRLFSEIREKRNLAYEVQGGAEIGKRYAYNFVYIGTMKENIDKVRMLILKEFEKVSKGLSEKELLEVKQQIIGQYNLSMEDSQTQLVNLIASEVQGKAEDFYEFEENIKKVKLEDVKKMSSKIKEGNYSFFALVPKK